MNKKLPSYFLIAIIGIFSFISAVNGQANGTAEVPFKSRFSTTINGDLVLVANNSVSISNHRYAPEDDYNLTTNNNGLIMDYINIDPGPGIFSSSSARFVKASECSEIVYAGLYWSGIYSVGDNTGIQMEGDAFYRNPDGTPLPDTRPDFKTIKFRPPGTNYMDITSENVIFDGWAGSPTNNDPQGKAAKGVPYVCYADVTNILQGLSDPDGDYTVANIRAFTGQTTIGSSAGWVLAIVADDPNLAKKSIQIYDGFAQVLPGDISNTYTFDGLRTVPSGPVKAECSVAGLDGDTSIAGDQFLIRANNAPTTGGYDGEGFNLLFNGANPANNFFNSTISKNGIIAGRPDRNPGSANTLGFDVDSFFIPNGGNDNTLIGNNEEGLTFKMKTSGDAYNIFMNALEIEVIEPEVNMVLSLEDSSGNDNTGGMIFLGETLYYKLTVQNVGNDNAINTVISDQLPLNVNEDLSEITADDPRIIANYTFDPITRRFTFPIPDDLLEIGDASFDIRFRVDVVSSCEELRDACSTELTNIASVSYEGGISGIQVNDKLSFSTIDTCGKGVAGGVSVYILNEGCSSSSTREELLCDGASTTLTGGDEYSFYEWTFPDGSTQNTQSIVVTEIGTYTLNATDTICRSFEETWNVVPINVNTTNPIEDYADLVVSCSIDNERIPEIYLCGDEVLTLDISDSVDASTVVWQYRYVDTCDTASTDGCPNRGASCVWGVDSISPILMLNGGFQNHPVEGQYQVSIEYVNGCIEHYYFNVFQRKLDPILEKRDIICGEPGLVRVTNVSVTDYEFSIDEVTFQASNEFTITNPGDVTVYIRETASPVPCTFEEVITILQDCTLATDTIKNTLDATIYPNPTKGPVTISTGIDEVTVMDLTGKIVFKTTDASFDIGHLSKGIYFVKVKKEDQTGISRLVRE